MTDQFQPTRRGFIAGAAALGAAVTVGDLLAKGPPSGKSRIVQVEHPGATTGKTTLDDAVVKRMIHEALMLYAGTKTAAEALAKYFKKDEKIAIKINTLGSPYSAVNKITAFTVAELFVEMGAKPSNVRIFDQYNSRMRKAGYRMRRNDTSYWVTQHRGKDKAVNRYEHTYPDGRKRKVDFHWCNEIVWADAVLNLCIPKDHDLTGVTGSLKNMAMGCVKPTARHYSNKANPGYYTVVPRFHKNNCDPALPWLYSQDMIKGKVRLIMADALRVLYHGGPQDKPRYRELYNQIWVAQDPVALDTHILDLVNGLRKKHKMKPVEEDLFRNRHRLPTYLKTAEKMGLGHYDRTKVTFEKKVLS